MVHTHNAYTCQFRSERRKSSRENTILRQNNMIVSAMAHQRDELPTTDQEIEPEVRKLPGMHFYRTKPMNYKFFWMRLDMFVSNTPIAIYPWLLEPHLPGQHAYRQPQEIR